MEQYDREELYEKVWEKPMLKVAEEYGVSSVGLGKTCRKLCVPVPGRGHWAKLAHGHQGVRKIPLPKLDKVPVIFRSPIAAKKPANFDQSDPELSAVDQLLSSGALNAQPVDPPSRAHPLIRHTASLLRSRSRKDEHRGLAGGLQHGATTQFAGVSDAGRICGGQRLWKRRWLRHLGKRSAFPTFPQPRRRRRCFRF